MALKPPPSDLLPVNWEAMKPLYEGGHPIKPLGRQFGVSPAGIRQHASKHGWTRELQPAIHKRAAELLEREERTKRQRLIQQLPQNDDAPLPRESSPKDQAVTVELNAQALAAVQSAHRTLAADMREQATAMLDELRVDMGSPEVFGQVIDLLQTMGEKPTADERAAMLQVMELLGSLPKRAKVLKDLVELTARIIGMERENYGLDAQDGTGGRFTVVIKDYTGKGDKDAPPLPPLRPEDEI